MKAHGVLEPLFRAARRTNELALRRLNERRRLGPEIRAAHTALLPHIDWEGTRITDLAERLGVTKQAVSPLVDELEDMGALVKIPDPRDGRAKLVVFSEEGQRGLVEGMTLLGQLESEFAAAIGQKKVELLGAILRDLLEHLDALERAHPAERRGPLDRDRKRKRRPKTRNEDAPAVKAQSKRSR